VEKKLNSNKKKLEQEIYEKFIIGENVNLCIPNTFAITEDGWSKWFNKVNALQSTQHGVFPNHQSSQLKLLESLKEDKTKIVLLICDKKFNRAFGVISLQNIDFQKKSAEVAINIGSNDKCTFNPLSSLEAMALITSHGFKEVGLERIYAGQAYPSLSLWNKHLELIGFKTEGFESNSFVRGHDIQDTVLIAIHYNFYRKIINKRGSLWRSNEHIKNLIKLQPKKSFAEKLKIATKDLDQKHFEYLF